MEDSMDRLQSLERVQSDSLSLLTNPQWCYNYGTEYLPAPPHKRISTCKGFCRNLPGELKIFVGIITGIVAALTVFGVSWITYF